mgnify:CR=1 FL=1
MRAVLQRVTRASVTVDGEVLGKIGKGFMILLGVENSDTEEITDKWQTRSVSCVFLKMKWKDQFKSGRRRRRTVGHQPVYLICGLQKATAQVS